MTRTLALLILGLLAFAYLRLPPRTEARAMLREIKEGQSIIDARRASLKVFEDIQRIEAIKQSPADRPGP